MKDTWLQDYLTAWNSREGKLVGEWMADDATYDDVPMGEMHQGREAIVALVDGMKDLSTDYHFNLVNGFSTETSYVVEWEWFGTHDGDGAGVPATGKPFRIRGVSVGSLRDEKIVFNRDYWNMADLLTQIGVLPAV